jgi:aromatic ring-opening dioxygenase LigB subunit
VDAVRANDLARLLEVDQDWVERARTEGIEPLLTLHGLVKGTGLRADVLCYEVPTYFGMLCAAYAPPAPGR